MFNLLVSGNGWPDRRGEIGLGRTLEYTHDDLIARFKPEGLLDLEALRELPTLFMEETGGEPEKPVRTGTITRATLSKNTIALEYVFDTGMPTLTNATVEELASELGIGEWEFTRTHWAVKDHDLFKVLLQNVPPRRPQPKVFNIKDPEAIDDGLVSAMMPFRKEFDEVFTTIAEAAADVDLSCLRADDIWEDPKVMQDVVTLIDTAKIVVADCTSRNPNVFYEIGIAHTLGREVVLIAQSEDDIPFDLRHLRYVTYHNNGEGRETLKARLFERFKTVCPERFAAKQRRRARGW